MPIRIEREQFPYTARFCEENIWRLGQQLVQQGVPAGALQAVVLSNAGQRIALCRQAAVPAGQLIVWDYHVVLRLQDDEGDWILDFDTRLPFVTPRAVYARDSFIPPVRLPAPYRPLLRLVPMAEYLARFSSDRHHMRDAAGREIVPFPPQPPILPGPGIEAITLQDYVSMQPLAGSDSRVVDYSEWL